MTQSGPLLRWSLRRALLYILLPIMACLIALELCITYKTATEAVNSAYDRSLFSAVKAIDSKISTQSGAVSIELPYDALEFFQLSAGSRAYFKVATEDRLTEVGYLDLPAPPRPPTSRKPDFYDADYHGTKLRIASYVREIEYARGQATTSRILIQVAETTTLRTQLINSLFLEALIRDVLLLLCVIGLPCIALSLLLKPLTRLHDDISARTALDLAPIDTAPVPVDIRPLVQAINQYIARNRKFTEDRRRFIDDASHQLRTPLTILRAQIDYLLRENDPQNIKQAVSAISTQLDDATRITIQMLALARADSSRLACEHVNLESLGEQVACKLALQARVKKIDLELDAPASALIVSGDAHLLGEAATNMLDNAIKFAPQAGHITIKITQAGEWALFSVVDDGPGIPEDQLSQTGQRFFRARNAPPGGTGLGLAIAHTIAERHGGSLVISNVTIGHGCIATLQLPLAENVLRASCDTFSEPSSVPA